MVRGLLVQIVVVLARCETDSEVVVRKFRALAFVQDYCLRWSSGWDCR